MSDLIRRQAAIEAVYEALRTPLPCYGNDLLQDSMTLAKAIVKNIPSAEPERKWIPVTEALPEEKEMVLITNNKGHVRCGQYKGTFDDKNYRWWWKHNILEEVLAWMPLPEPWRGE